MSISIKPKSSILLKALLFVLILSINLIAQNKWYLSTTGSGNQDGTTRANARLYTNYASLNIQPGDTVYFVQGNYNQQFVVRKNGSPGNLITYMPDPLNTGDVVFTNINNNAWIIRDYNYFRIKGIKFRNVSTGILAGRNRVVYLDSLDMTKVLLGINIYGKVSPSGNFVYDPTYDPGIHSATDSLFIRWSYIATDTQTTLQTDCITIYWAHGVRILGNYILQANVTGDGHNDCIQTGHGLGDVIIANNVLINKKLGQSQILMAGMSWGKYNFVLYNNISIHYGAGTSIFMNYAYNGLKPGYDNSDFGEGECYVINNTFIGKRNIFVTTWYYNLNNPSVLPLDSLYAVNNIFYMIQSDGTVPFGVQRKPTDPINALYANNNIYAINGGSSTNHISTTYGAYFQGSWTLSYWNNTSPLKMYNSLTSLPTFQNFQYNANLYWQEDLRLTSNSVGIAAGRNDIKVKGNQWVNLKTLIESFGLEWKGFNNPYVSWSNPVPRSETNPTIGAWEFPSGTSGNLPPNAPSNPNPANGATVQSTTLTLSWNCTDPNGDPLTYDVYFGTNNNPTLAAQNVQNTSYVVNNLNAGITYYWRIVAKDNQGATNSGNVWNFSTIGIDTVPPRLISATLLDSVTLSLTFSENLKQSTVNNTSNYVINNGIQVNNVLLNGSILRLSTSPHSPGFYTVTVNNVTDSAGNLINPSFRSITYGYNPDPLPELLKFIPARTSASSVPEPEHTPEKTFDGLGYNSGDPTSRWAGYNLPQWIGYDLGDVVMLTKTRVQFYNWENGRIYNYSIQISVDSINWNNVKSNIYSQLAEWSEETFEPVPARYIRILVHSNNQNNWASLWETEFYGQLMVSNHDGNSRKLPTEFVLEQNYPNPFNPSTKISWQSPVAGHQILKVFDMLGNEVAILVNEYKEPGRYEVEFDASNLPSGVYIYRLQSDDYINTKKMILLR